MTLCEHCAERTPDKLTKVEFDEQYWGVDFDNVPYDVRKEFYQDYMTSFSTFEEYVRDTTERSVEPEPVQNRTPKPVLWSNVRAGWSQVCAEHTTEVE